MPEGNPPEQIIPTKLADDLAVISKAVFQTGMSWRVVEAKWAGTLEVFRGRRKVEATIASARRLFELDEAHGSFQNYRHSHADFDALIKDPIKNFKFWGRMEAFYML